MPVCCLRICLFIHIFLSFTIEEYVSPYHLTSLTACAVSFALASEVLLSLESVLVSIRTILDNDLNDIGKDIHTGFSKELLSFLSKKLGTFAYKLLMQKCDGVNDIEDGQKVKVC